MINYIRYILGFIAFQYAIVSVFFLILGVVVAPEYFVPLLITASCTLAP